MDAGFVALLDGLGAGDADGASLGLDAQVRFVHAWHLDDHHDVLAFAEDVHRRIAAAAAGAGLQPVAGAQLVEGILELE
jgi:hypothetical protein